MVSSDTCCVRRSNTHTVGVNVTTGVGLLAWWKFQILTLSHLRCEHIHTCGLLWCAIWWQGLRVCTLHTPDVKIPSVVISSGSEGLSAASISHIQSHRGCDLFHWCDVFCFLGESFHLLNLSSGGLGCL